MATYVNRDNMEYIEQLYSQYKQNPQTISNEWRKFFEGFELGQQRTGEGYTVSEDVLK